MQSRKERARRRKKNVNSDYTISEFSEFQYEDVEKEIRASMSEKCNVSFREVFELWLRISNKCFLITSSNQSVVIVRVTETKNYYLFDAVWLCHYKKEKREAIMRFFEVYFRKLPSVDLVKRIWWSV